MEASPHFRLIVAYGVIGLLILLAGSAIFNAGGGTVSYGQSLQGHSVRGQGFGEDPFRSIYTRSAR